MLATMIAIAVVLLVIGIPIYLVFLTSALVALLGFTNVPLNMISQTLFDSMNTMVLLAVPYFILAGDIMSRSKMTDSLTGFFNSLIGRIPGSMGVVTVLSCCFFGAISGSSPAAVATIGKIMYPEMIKDNYGVRFTSALITSAGNLAIIVPPSITMILYSSVTNASVGRLFIAGIVPGLILSILLSGYVIYFAQTHSIIHRTFFSWRDILEKSKVALPTLLMPIAVLGGIYAGIFTPTEAAIISVLYATVVAFIFNKDFGWKDLFASLKDSAILTAQILVIMSSAAVFSQVLVLGQVPYQLTQLINELNITPVMFLIIVNIVFLIAGMFIDSASAIVALIPLMAPIVAAMDIDIVHFGVIIVLNLAIGMFTPPFGLNLFTTLALFKVDLRIVSLGLIPFFLIFFFVLLIVTYISPVALWLPNLMYR